MSVGASRPVIYASCETNSATSPSDFGESPGAEIWGRNLTSGAEISPGAEIWGRNRRQEAAIPAKVKAHVMSVGASRPVIWASCETKSATSPSDFTASRALTEWSPVGPTYFSRYSRMVAPDTPVPERRKMMREPSRKRKRTPWFEDTDLSIGSVYENTSAVESLKGTNSDSSHLPMLALILVINSFAFSVSTPSVVVPGVVVTAVGSPVPFHDVLHPDQRLTRVRIARGEDGEPCEHSPEAVLLSYMVGPSPVALFPADERGVLGGVHEVTEELPPRGRLEDGMALAVHTLSSAQEVGMLRAA
eukprot:CAMPEP_0181293994 /NCGR_PEP_ID=MMETSP1101-20121128/3360_1 /TAXON_ID=46948 /ORGANISM="Rhodomonas abbreviata, Strain Caron Lab Isolate" /LENGTH=303 /DNA_ID=CAMNT_0023398615 /DNA_START=139 /DNA_END=1047 /DNA_ORIENTATION=-